MAQCPSSPSEGPWHLRSQFISALQQQQGEGQHLSGAFCRCLAGPSSVSGPCHLSQQRHSILVQCGAGQSHSSEALWSTMQKVRLQPRKLPRRRGLAIISLWGQTPDAQRHSQSLGAIGLLLVHLGQPEESLAQSQAHEKCSKNLEVLVIILPCFGNSRHTAPLILSLVPPSNPGRRLGSEHFPDPCP